jgi:hypothetical protein
VPCFKNLPVSHPCSKKNAAPQRMKMCAERV